MKYKKKFDANHLRTKTKLLDLRICSIDVTFQASRGEKRISDKCVREREKEKERREAG